MFDNHNSCFCKYIPKTGILWLLHNKQGKKKKIQPPSHSATFLNHCAFESLMLFYLLLFFFFFWIVSLSSWLLMAECYLKHSSQCE